MKVFEKLFVGVSTREKLAFVTPYETNAAGNKRKKTVKKWLKKNGTSFEAVFDNLPLSGFRIVESISRVKNENKVFRIYDPRNFYIEITSKNMMYIIRNCTVEYGVIQEKLQYVRNKSQNFLEVFEPRIPISSSEEIDYEKGDSILDESGDELLYLGQRNYNAYDEIISQAGVFGEGVSGTDHIYVNVNTGILNRKALKLNAIHKYGSFDIEESQDYTDSYGYKIVLK